MNNPYILLGISTSDDSATAKTKFRKLCKIYHPDNPKTGNKNKFEEILEAWKNIEGTLQDNNTMWGHSTLFTLKRRNVCPQQQVCHIHLP